MDWGHRNPGDGRIVGDVVPLSTSDDMGVEMAMENPFLAASQAEMPAQRQQSRSFIRDIVTSLEDPNIASTASEGTTVGERAGSKSMSGGLAPSDAEVQDVQGKSEDGSQEKHEKCLATLNGKDSSSLLKGADFQDESEHALEDRAIHKYEGGSGDDLVEPGEAVDIEKIPETQILRRMQPILMPGQDGVGGLAVKASNIKSMGLVLEGANGNEVPVPYKVFAKADVLQEIRNLGKDSDWAEHKSVLRVCPLDELLVVHDPHKLYGHSFAWVFTEVAYDVMAKRLQECREAAVTMYVRDRADEARKKDKRQIQAPDDQFGNYVPPRTWSSTTIDITNEEIRRMELQPKRSLLTRIISKKYRLFKEPCHFQATSDKIHSSRPQKNNNFVGLRKELDFGVQATSTSTETEAQTYLCIPVNACTQYTNEDIWTKGIFKDPENKTFANFFSSVGNLVEAALEQNETINIFGEDFANLGTDEFINSQTSGDGLKELLNFTDLSFSKSKIISCIQRVPGSDSLIAYACMENATFEERIERSGRVAQAHILVWHFEDIIMPKAVFSAPSDVTIFCFCVVENQLYIVAGLISGQLAVWKTDALADPAGKSATENQKMNQRQKHPRKPIVTSSIDFSHKRTVSDIRVLPSGTDFRKNLRPVFNPNNSSTYLITSSGDGNIMIWDVSAAVHSAHLDNFQWRPFLQAPLKKAESGVDLGCCHLVIPKVEPPELTTTFWASTEDGEVLFGDWAHSGEERKFDYVKTLLNETRTYRPTLSFAISPFFEDIFLAVTDMAFYIWMADCPSPIFSSPTSGVPYACGSWSPTRPSVIFLGRHDGSLEVWDLSEQCQAYSSVFVVGAAAVTCLSFHPSRAGHRPSLAHGRRVTRPLHGRKGDALRDLGDSVLSLLAAGDASGIVHVLSLPRTLSTQTPGEVGVVRAMFLREREVISYVIQRREAIEKEVEILKRKGVRETEGSGLVKDAGAPHRNEEAELDAMETEYRLLEAACRKELGLADLEDRVPRGSTQDSSAGNTRNRMRK